MMNPVDSTAPKSIKFFNEGLGRVEGALKKFTVVPIVSSLTGGIEGLLGLVVCVTAASQAAFFKARTYLPVSKIRKDSWTKSESFNQAVTLMKDSVDVIAMGLLKAVPGFGNISAIYIYSLVEKDRSYSNVDKLVQEKDVIIKNLQEFKGRLEKENGELQTVVSNFEKTKNDLEDALGKVSSLNQSLKDAQNNYETQESELKNQIAQLKETLNSSGFDKDEIQKKLDQAISELNGLKDEYLLKIEGLQAELIKAQGEVAELKTEMKILDSELKKKKAENKKLKTDIETLNKEIEELKKQIETKNHVKTACSKYPHRNAAACA